MSLEQPEKRSPLTKLNWLDKAVGVYNYHIQLVRDAATRDKKWTIEMTASNLNRSVGSVSQDLTIASWVKTHEKQLRRFRSAKDALDYIKEKKREMIREIDLG